MFTRPICREFGVNGVGREVVGYEVEEAVTKVSDVATHALLLTLLAITEYRAATP